MAGGPGAPPPGLRSIKEELDRAGVISRDRETLFYSHLDDNLASRSVAVKLGARPIGWIWQLRPVLSR